MDSPEMCVKLYRPAAGNTMRLARGSKGIPLPVQLGSGIPFLYPWVGSCVG